MEIYDKTPVVLNTVDSQISKMISNGLDIDQIIISLDKKVSTFDKTLEEIPKEQSRYRLLYTHNRICQKRIKDFNFVKSLIDNFDVYSGFEVEKMFSLIKLKDKIGKEKFSVQFKIYSSTK